jgi:hypothetical protein
MRYVILYELEMEDLEKRVNEYIAIGFEPQGGVSVMYYPVYDKEGVLVKPFVRFYQAMISR